jgi:hypothetical protein
VNLRAAGAAAAVALTAWAAAGALASERPARLGTLEAGGDVRLASPEDGTAVLVADRMVPGDSVAGTVALANTGEADGSLTLTRSRLEDFPGASGSPLSAALELRVQDVSGSVPRTAYAGWLSDFRAVDLGRLAAGERRVYALSATLPAAAGNSAQGASTRIDLAWVAAPLAPAPTPTPVPVPVPTPVPTPVPDRTPTPASVLTLRIPWQRVLATSGITARAACDRRCRLSLSARVETAPRRGKRRRTLMARGVFRHAGTQRALRRGPERALKLHLTPRAMRVLRAELLRRGRAAIGVRAQVRSALGTATVTRRIVIVAPRRAARRAARPQRSLSRGSVRRR